MVSPARDRRFGFWIKAILPFEQREGISGSFGFKAKAMGCLPMHD
jgi:hypothetical protein